VSLPPKAKPIYPPRPAAKAPIITREQTVETLHVGLAPALAAQVENAATDEHDRFRHPWRIVACGFGLGVCTAAVMMAKAGESGLPGALAVLAFVYLLISLYAWIGFKHSKALAHKVLGIVGGAAALGGVVFLVWMLLKYVP